MSWASSGCPRKCSGSPRPRAPTCTRPRCMLTEEMHRSRDVLADRADLELVPDDDIKIFTATMDGIRIGAAGLHKSLREERTQRQADITDKEHALFEQTLAGDTRRHLADRIRQANELVEDMNSRLERVRTASRVAVRLVWQVDPQQSPGTRAARDLLLKDPANLSDANRQALYRFFRERVEEAQAANTARPWSAPLHPPRRGLRRCRYLEPRSGLRPAGRPRS